MKIDYSKDALFDPYALEILNDRYLLPEEKSPQEALARAAKTFGTDEEHAQRLYDYASKHWFMFATPLLSNGGSSRGLPVSCYLSFVGDSRKSILEHYTENGWLASLGGGIGSYFGALRSDGAKTSSGSKSTGSIPFMHVVDSQMMAFSQGVCYTADTEVLTDKGWKLFKDLDASDFVASVTAEKQISFVKPLDLVEEDFDGDLCTFSNSSTGLDLQVTPNHSLVIEQQGQEYNKKKWKGKLEKIRAELYSPHRGNRMHVTFPTATASEYSSLDSWDRLRVAFQADGSNSGRHYVTFHIKKSKKIERLINILDTNGIEYSKTKGGDGAVTIYFNSGANILTKDFSWVDISAVSKEWCEDFITELAEWDCHKHKGKDLITYSNTNKEAADKVHAIACLAGYRSRMKTIERDESRQTIYNVVIRGTNTPLSGDSILKGTLSYKGKVYCAVVESGMLLVRRNGLSVVCGNTRRAAYASYQDISHPEILEFIQMRKPTGGDHNRKNLNLHHAVNIPDAFMEIIAKCMEDPKADDAWPLVDPHTKEIKEWVSAKYLWELIIHTRMETGEPFIHFIDHTNSAVPEVHKQLGLFINNSNLCTEITLPTTEDRTAVCCITSLNLEYYDEWKDTCIVEDLVEMLDNVLTVFIQKAPESISKAVYSASQERSIGLGTMGFHSYLQKMGVAFESQEAEKINKKIFSEIAIRSDTASAYLGVERGVAPDYINAFGTEGNAVGRRNVYIRAIAPNASTSIICGNTSPGIEPFAANGFRQVTHNGSNIFKNKYLDKIINSVVQSKEDADKIWKKVIADKGSVQKVKAIPDDVKKIFKTAQEIDQQWIVKHAADRYAYIDQGQSVNLFFKADEEINYVHDIHFNAWKQGLKTLYYCRSTVTNRAENINERFDRKAIKPVNQTISCVGCAD